MLRNLLQRILLPGVVLLSVAACSWLIPGGGGPLDNTPDPEPTPTRLGAYAYSNPTAFDMLYPAGWTNNVVRLGVMVIAPPEVFSLDVPGPSVTIYRVSPGFSDPDLALDIQLQQFLERGPFREGFEIRSEIAPRDLGQYAGFTVDIEREETGDGLDAVRGRVVVIRADTAALYYVMATAPTEMWADNVVFFAAIYESMHFNE